MRYLCNPGNHNIGALMKSKEKDRNGTSMELQSLELMGVFLGFFGLVVAVAAVIPDNWTGRIADLTAGGVLVSIGIWSFLKGRAHRNH